MTEFAAPQERQLYEAGPFALSVLALIVGAVTGLGAVAFRALVAVVHNLFFLGTLSIHYDANQFTPPSPWGGLMILAPVIGGIGVVWLVRTFAPEARGHGVPEVMDAIYYKEGRIRPIVVAVKSLASALAIGSGASIGREGPIIQIGSAIASTLGQLLPVPTWQRITLVAAGAGAGIAATFNTPLGAVLFAIELMMPEVSVRTFLPVALATAFSTWVGQLWFGASPAFTVVFGRALEVGHLSALMLLAHAGLGLLCGLASWAFIRLLMWMEELFPRLPGNDYTRHMLGMLGVGLMMTMLFQFGDHYYIEGVSYAGIQAILNHSLAMPLFLLLLFAAKLLATTLSLGSGSSGGIFSPSLFMGATLGAAFVGMLDHLLPVFGFAATSFDMAAFAMVGMAATVGGATGAAMTGVVMIFEMTRDYHIVVPMVIAVAIAISVRRLLIAENIYTMKLAQRGHHIPTDRHANLFMIRHAEDVMNRRLTVLPANLPVAAARKRVPDAVEASYILVVEEMHLVGLVRVGPRRVSLDAYSDETRLEEIARRDFSLIHRNTVLFNALTRLAKHVTALALVVDRMGIPRAEDAIGVIDKDMVANSVIDGFRPYVA